MSKPLTQIEINQRLVRLRNLERLYVGARARIGALEQENRHLLSIIIDQQAMIERLMMRVAELEKMVFKSKRSSQESKGDTDLFNDKSDRAQADRTKESYQRPIPSDEDITSEQYLAIKECDRCGTNLSQIRVVVRFEEDINLPVLNRPPPRTVTKYQVEQGWCSSCHRWCSAKDIRGQMVALGPNVSSLICYWLTIVGCSFSQVKDQLKDLYQLDISDGEIAAVLAKRAEIYSSEYQAILTRIRGQPGAHIDETVWSIQSYDGRNYAWLMTGTKTAEEVIRLADNRGKGQAEALLGPNYRHVRVTDCYKSYKKLPGSHQICWAHLIRTARDIAYSEGLPETKREHCFGWYEQLKELYRELAMALKRPFDFKANQQVQYRLLKTVRVLCRSTITDPKKLSDLKQRLLEYQQELFTCLTIPGIPAHNNKAEQHIRHLVLKRHRSQGSKTDRGAQAFAIVYSVLRSIWNTDRVNLFPKMHQLLTLNQ